MAAMVSALLEGAELHVAERIDPPADHTPLIEMGVEAVDLWHRSHRAPTAIRLEPDLPRPWLPGRCLMTGRAMPMPFDLVSLDFTMTRPTDCFATSSGLATGNDVSEAAAGGVAELLERDLTQLFHEATSPERRALEIDLQSIDDDIVVRLIRRIQRAGYDVRLWSLGQQVGIAAVRCVIVAHGQPEMPPTAGSGCHPDRSIAAVRALLEAVQVHATLVAGGRDDLRPCDYDDPRGRKLDMIFRTLSFDRGALTWTAVPDTPVADAAAALDVLLGVVERRSSLPVVGIEHDSGVDGLFVFRVLAPGLLDPCRAQPPVAEKLYAEPIARRGRGAVMFVGPSLGDAAVPSNVERLPPAIGGDLSRLLGNLPSAVGLVDGCFGTAPSVWHKEILALLAAGVPVLGAASLGALRAAELSAFGMVGVGRVFEAYREGAVIRDDAVMLVHGPFELGSRALTVALIDAEAAIDRVPLPDRDRRMLQRIVRTTPYYERSWDRCLRTFTARTGLEPPIAAETLIAQPSIKQADTLMLMRLLQDGLTHAPVGLPDPPITAGYARLLAATPAPP